MKGRRERRFSPTFFHQILHDLENLFKLNKVTVKVSLSL